MAAAGALSLSLSPFFVVSLSLPLLLLLLLLSAFFSPAAAMPAGYDVAEFRSPPPMIGGSFRHLAQQNWSVCGHAVAAAAAHCPVKCFRPDPVCGTDGVTYWCGCTDAVCSGARVAKLGFCEVGSGGSASVSGQALLLVHIVWLIVLGVLVLFGFS